MTAFYIPNPLKLRTMQDAINMFLACIAIPYIYILVEFLVVRPVPWHTWLNFIKFHYGAVLPLFLCVVVRVFGRWSLCGVVSGVILLLFLTPLFPTQASSHATCGPMKRTLWCCTP